jgi:hypothetical protein
VDHKALCEAIRIHAMIINLSIIIAFMSNLMNYGDERPSVMLKKRRNLLFVKD